MKRFRAISIWAVFAISGGVPIAAAAVSPLLEWREPIYIAAGFAGVVAMVLLFAQPLLAGGYLPGLLGPRGRRVHRVIGGLLVVVVLLHVAGLWLTSPPDVIDALLLSSPTPFSVWGVIAMWAIFASALLAACRRRFRSRLRLWRLGHSGLAIVIVSGSILHALLIEGTMETVSKFVLCLFVAIGTLKTFMDLRLFARSTKPR